MYRIVKVNRKKLSDWGNSLLSGISEEEVGRKYTSLQDAQKAARFYRTNLTDEEKGEGYSIEIQESYIGWTTIK